MMDFKKVEANIRSCVISTKRLTLKQLNHDYKTLMGEWIPFRDLGFNSLEQLIETSNLLALERHGSDIYVVAARSAKSNHISDLVSQQKSGKAKPNFGKKPKNSKWVQPPRMQQHYQQQQHQAGGRWRPKANYQMNSYNNYSSRPQAVNHSQFVTKTPSVASKIVIPEHSTYNQKPAAQSSASALPDINQRLNTKRFQENMVKTTTVNESVNSEQSKSNRLGHKDSGLSPNSASLHVTKPSNEVNNTNAKNRTTNNNLVADLSLSARSRISKKMSELKLDRDSGNSSPTNESLPSPSKCTDFPRTGDHIADLKRFVVLHKLGEIEESTTSVVISKTRSYSCKIKIASYPPWSSYPEDFYNPADAKVRCYEKALDELIPRFKRKSLLISSQEDVLERVPPLLEKHPHGVWAWQLLLDYTDKYNEVLPDDWTSIVDVSPYVHIEKMLDNYILYHCQPGDVLQKGQQRTATAVDVSNVSVPANTVKFGEDNRLLAQIACVISAKEVWCEQVGTKERELFDEMVEQLQLYYKRNEAKCIPNSLLPGGYYIAKYENYYYRVRILTLNDDEVECFSIDSGAEITVKKTDIFVLRRDYATSEAQAFVCRLIGLEDLYDMTIHSECLAALEDQTVILELAEDISDNNGNLVLPVCMYYTDTGASINEELITKLTVELATPTLKEGINEVYISHIDPSGDVLVYIKSKAYDNLQSLRQQVEKQIIANPPRNVPKVTKLASKDKLYFMKDCTSEGGVWRRTQLIDWSPEGTLAQVYFVDDGHTNVITVANEVLYPLDTLHDVFSNYPHQAIRVKMALKTIPENFIGFAKGTLPKNEPVLLKIIGTKDDYPLVKLFKRNADGLFCINESLDLECELKQKDDQFRSKLNVPQRSIDTVPSAGTLKCPPLPSSSEDFFPVQISMAVNPYNFFVQPLDSLPQLEALMDKLQELYKDVKYGKLKIEDVLPGHIYASTYTDGRWYRTSVIKVLKSGSVSVFYCDYGYYQTLPVSQLVFLDKKFMELPYQALKAKLGVKPKQNKWTMKDCDEFKKLVEKKPFFARLLEIENDFLYESDILLKVVLVDTSDKDTDVFIDEELVKRGIAIFE